MTLHERQAHLNNVYNDLQGINARRAYVSTLYGIWQEKYVLTNDGEAKSKADAYRNELSSIDEHGLIRCLKLRNAQTRYLVEYEGEVADMQTGRISDRCFQEELYLFENCDIDTFSFGWDMEDESTQNLLYEIADYLLQYRLVKYTVRNVKRIA
jgi:hypothetical protein